MKIDSRKIAFQTLIQRLVFSSSIPVYALYEGFPHWFVLQGHLKGWASFVQLLQPSLFQVIVRGVLLDELQGLSGRAISQYCGKSNSVHSCFLCQARGDLRILALSPQNCNFVSFLSPAPKNDLTKKVSYSLRVLFHLRSRSY